MTKASYHIGIAGAGIAGLAAGVAILREGHSVSIFEARPCTGGRIRSEEVNGYLVESGPEFIHGNLKETIGLLEKYNIPFEPVYGKLYHARGGEMQESYEIAEGWEQLLDKMKLIKSDIPFAEFLIKNFPGTHFEKLRESAIRFAEGFDLADVALASTIALIKEWELEEQEQYRIAEGYGMLIQSLENEFLSLGGGLYLNRPVKTVNWSSERLKIIDSKNQESHFDKLMVCLPLPVFGKSIPSAERVVFEPSLPDKPEALSKIGFGTVVKIILIWDSSFWKAQIADALFIFSDEFIPTWWTRYPRDLPILTGWLGGPPAEKVSDKPPHFFFEKSMESLSAIFSIPAGELKKQVKEYRIFNWKSEPWCRGAYSYSKVGSEEAKKIFRTPVQNRIYFAGEALYQGPYPGTVEAALISGKETSAQLLREIREK